MRKAGTKPDADKSIVYNFDFVVRMDGRWQGRVIKSRGQDIVREGETIKRVSWDIFAPLAAEFSVGSAVHHPNKDTAINAEVEPLSDRTVATEFMTHWRKQGIQDSEILKALDVERVSQYAGGRAAANAAVQAWLDVQMMPKPSAPVTPVTPTAAKQSPVSEPEPEHDTAGDDEPFDETDTPLHAYAGVGSTEDVPF